MLRLALILSLALSLVGCPPTGDDDDDSSGSDDDDASLECEDPLDDPPPVTDCGLHEGLDAGWLWTSFEADDTEVLLVREPVGQGAGHTTIYANRGFGLVMDGCVLCIDDEARLDYDTGHHNWWEDAWLALDDVELHLHIQYQPLDDDPMNEWVWTYYLEGVSPDDRDEVLWGPIELAFLDGEILPGYTP